VHKDENVFTDKQVARIKEIIRDEQYIQTGKVTVRFILLAFGAICTIAFGAVLAYLGIKR
jgi:hypothetical protein